MDATHYLAHLQALLPPGRALTREPNAVLTSVLAALAEEFSRVDARAAQLLEELDPRTTTELLADWERVAALPDACIVATQTTGERRDALLARLTARGGQSRQYFIDTAQRLGFVGRSLTTGTARAFPALDLDFRTGVLPAGLTFTRASTATRVNASGLIETVAADVPRFDYDPVTLAIKGLLVEEARTNLVTNSSAEVNLTGWLTNAGAVNTRDQTYVIEGAWSVKCAIPNASSSGLYLAGVPASASTAYAYSVWVYADAVAVGKTFSVGMEWKSGGGANGASTSQKTLVAGWQRLVHTATSAVGTDVIVPILYTTAAQGAFNIWVDLPQVEAGAFPTSAIPTTTAAATRSADICYDADVSATVNAAEGTAVVEASAPQDYVAPACAASLSDGTTANHLYLHQRTGIDTIRSGAMDAGGTGNTQFLFSHSASTAKDVIHHAAVAYRQDDAAGCIDGGAVSTDSSVAVASPLTYLRIGGRYDGGQQWNGHIRRVRYYPKRLPNAVLQTLSTGGEAATYLRLADQREPQYAVKLNGTNQYVQVPSINPPEITIAATFIRETKDPVNGDPVFGGWYWNADTQLQEGYELRYGINTDSLAWVLVTQDAGGLRAVKTAAWTVAHVGKKIRAMGTYDSTTGVQALYVDGVLIQTQQHPAGNTIVPLTNYPDMRIGGSRINVGFFPGTIDEVRAYDRALSATEAAADASRETPSNSGLVLWLPFREGSGTVTADASGNGNHGTLVAAPTWVPGLHQPRIIGGETYPGQLARLTGGTGSGQERTVVSYDDENQILEVTPAWDPLPDDTSEYNIVDPDAPLTITEFRPFVAGSEAGDELTNDEWAHAWRVNALLTNIRTFKAGSGAAGEPLRVAGNEALECAINQLAPAHTVVSYAYTP